MDKNHIQPFPINAAVITVSTTRTIKNDTSGKTICNLLNNKSIPVNHYTIVPDRIDAIRDELFTALKKANCIILNGGTGLTHDDCTIEAVHPFSTRRSMDSGRCSAPKVSSRLGLRQCSPEPSPV